MQLEILQEYDPFLTMGHGHCSEKAVHGWGLLAGSLDLDQPLPSQRSHDMIDRSIDSSPKTYDGNVVNPMINYLVTVNPLRTKIADE